MCYIDDDTVSAETYIKKASFLVDLSTSEETRLQFKVCYARILDAKRKFLEAAMRYYEISQITTQASRIKLKIDIDDIKVFRLYQTYLCIIFCSVQIAYRYMSLMSSRQCFPRYSR